MIWRFVWAVFPSWTGRR